MRKNARAGFLPITLVAALIAFPLNDALAEDAVSYSIPAQDVSASLLAFATASQLRFIAPSEDLKGLTAGALNGKYRPTEALKILLEGTELDASVTPDGFLSVKSRKSAVPPDRAPTSPGPDEQGSLNGTNLAQAPQSAPTDDAEVAVLTLEEIVVTSRRQAERLQELPLNVTAYTDEAIRRQNIMNIFDLSNLTPNLNFENIGYRLGQFLTVRSLNSGGAGGGRASVYIDGVYVAPPSNYESIPFANIERIEVMKGPQSALYGRATFSGAINYILKQPTDEVTGRVDFYAATLDEKNINAYISGPVLGDKLMASASYYYMTFDGPQTWANVVGGHRNGSQRTDSGALKVLANVSDDFSFTGRVSYSADDDGNWTTQYIDPSQRNFSVVRPNGSIGRYVQGVVPDPCFCNLNYNVNDLSRPGIRRFQWRTSLTADAEVGEHNLSVTAAHNFQSERGQTDLDGTSLKAFTSFLRTSTRDNSLDVRVSSPQDRRLRYSFGGYYLDLRVENRGFLRFDSLGGAISANPSVALTKDRSAFGAVYFDVTDRVTLSLEARYQSERLKTTNVATLLSFRTTHNSLVPRIYLDYRPVDDLVVYAVYSEGTTPGSFNVGRVADESQRVVLPETLRNYEIGFKSEWLSRRLLINAAGYYMDWINLISSATYVTPQGLPAPVQENRGLARVVGGEIEAQALLAQGLDARATFSYNDAHYVRNCSTNAGILFGRSDQPAPTVCQFVNGNTLEGQIPTQVSFSLGYTADLTEDWNWYARGEYMHAEGQFADDMNLAKSAAANTINFRIGVNRDDLSVELFCRNCTNEDAMTRAVLQTDFRIGSTTATGMSVGGTSRRPRQFGLKTTAAF
ncbi:MAG: TonB-dependent receptor [Rhodospirillaceae bacterium]|nr:TonB-dependent receptor [Rhodospirillaceae bacterium]